MQGADILVESLLKEGVDTIFGHPGGAILPINDALYSGRIRHILTRHEQGAVHMAEGYARATGRPGQDVSNSSTVQRIYPGRGSCYAGWDR